MVFPERIWLMFVLLRQQLEHRSVRYGGRLAGLRCDDLAAAPLTSLMARYPGMDWGAVDEVCPSVAPIKLVKRQPQCCPHGAALACPVLPENSCRRWTVMESTVRLRPGSSWSGGSRNRWRRCAAGDCRGRRKHVAGAVSS